MRMKRIPPIAPAIAATGVCVLDFGAAVGVGVGDSVDVRVAEDMCVDVRVDVRVDVCVDVEVGARVDVVVRGAFSGVGVEIVGKEMVKSDMAAVLLWNAMTVSMALTH
ncbi:hypothetical protein BC939DRAFT_479950 [Gamsiella multidivaricata]|uniref:uncharacterized protein n=1 Tax=Gamsiella multidivaricata TaxID=101098 RepID=UPI00221EEE4E|nr:uncharacterized protein BC939DRAFT_479950 [Gamsiella multidivaricata]KAI7819010.1 hypothetical protein BC939DRAFT_479950 [Gamsiella multidivaricata]